MADAWTVERREVPVAEWARAVAEARDAAYTFFDWRPRWTRRMPRRTRASTSSAT